MAYPGLSGTGNQQVFTNRMAEKIFKDKKIDKESILLSLIECKTLINNSETFISILQNDKNPITYKKLKLIINNIQNIKYKLENNIQLDQNDIKFNDWLYAFTHRIIIKYYPFVNEKIFVNKLTDMYVFEKKLILEKQKTL